MKRSKNQIFCLRFIQGKVKLTHYKDVDIKEPSQTIQDNLCIKL